MTTRDQNDVALLVDGDNVSATLAASILVRARQLGHARVARVFLNVAARPAWEAASGFQIVHAGRGKNAADMVLAIDALELALRDQIRTFVLCTSDRDFSHLAFKLRALGCHVLGLGAGHAPQALRGACSDFETLSGPSCVAATDLDRHIRSVIDAYAQGQNGMRLTDLNGAMRKLHDVRISKLPDKTWRAYLLARAMLYEVDAKGPEARVRIKAQGFG